MVSRSVLKLDKGKNADYLVTINPEHQQAFPSSNILRIAYHIWIQPSRKELRFASFPLMQLFLLVLFIFYKKTFRFTPAICKDCTVSRIQPGFLPTYEPWLIPTCESSNSHRQQTTFAAFPLSLQNGKCFESFPSVSFRILIFLSENCLQKFSASLYAFFSSLAYSIL